MTIKSYNFAKRKPSIKELEWWNGRHEGLKILWSLRPCGFKSRFEHFGVKPVNRRALHFFNAFHLFPINYRIFASMNRLKPARTTLHTNFAILFVKYSRYICIECNILHLGNVQINLPLNSTYQYFCKILNVNIIKRNERKNQTLYPARG